VGSEKVGQVGSGHKFGLNAGTSFGGRLNGARKNERDLREKDEL